MVAGAVLGVGVDPSRRAVATSALAVWKVGETGRSTRALRDPEAVVLHLCEHVGEEPNNILLVRAASWASFVVEGLGLRLVGARGVGVAYALAGSLVEGLGGPKGEARVPSGRLAFAGARLLVLNLGRYARGGRAGAGTCFRILLCLRGGARGAGTGAVLVLYRFGSLAGILAWLLLKGKKHVPD